MAITITEAQVARLSRYLLSKPDHQMTMRKLRDRVLKLPEFRNTSNLHNVLKECIKQIPDIATCDDQACGVVITIHRHDLLIEV